MFWVDNIEKELGENEVINDSKTPSGRVHVGSLRGVVLHYVIWKVLSEAGKKPTFLYGTDDYDPVDELPHDIPNEFRQYMGLPLCNVPSPDPKKADNFADYYMNEFIEIFNNLGIKPLIYKMSDFYKSGKMNEVIESLLNHEDVIRDIYLQVSGSKKPKTWHPFQVVCEKCKKIGTTLVHSFDGKEVEYTCEETMVKWAKGCKYHGKISPFNGNGKLPWKLEWVGKWKILGVTVEGAGKDHSSEGGSRDVSSEIFKRIFGGNAPYNIPYEFFLTGKKKMSSSKGLGSTSKDIADLIPPELLRFLMIRYTPNAVIDFDPIGDTIPRLFDEHDRCGNLFFNKEKDQVESLERAFELAQLNENGLKPRFFPRFSTIATLIQIPGLVLNNKIEEMKNAPLTEEDIEEIKLRKTYSEKWLDKCASDAHKFHVLEELSDEIKDEITDEQRIFINEVLKMFDQGELPGDVIHQNIYETTQKLGIKPGDGFKTIYQIFIGKKQGPKVGTFLAALD
ncbi:MAG: lysine--tRNA ligase, partial [Spirochaetota bacterium]|nr:lysine--tRNA ligase [Spirochaetota bacterium]